MRAVALASALLLPAFIAAAAMAQPGAIPADLLAGTGRQGVAASAVWAVRGAPAASWKDAQRAIPGALSISPDGLPVSWILLKVGASGPRPVITNAVTAEDLLGALGITLNDEDRVRPDPATLTPGMHLSVIRIRTVVRTIQETVPYQTQVTVSQDLASGESQVITPGSDGSALRTYRITYRNGRESRRLLLDEQILTDPVDAVLLVGPAPDAGHGTQVGQSSWYSCPTEGDFAAHLTLPKGTTVTVTNTDTGATVVVVINDRGPYGVPGRIIDLCSTAFAQIAPLSQGVANVSISW